MGSRTERFYKIELMIRQRGSVSFEVMLDALEVSPATLKRDLQFLRDRMGAPIVYHRDENAYRFADDHRQDRHELPGLWFDEKELHSLLMAHHLLSSLDMDGTLSRHLQPLLDRIHQLLGTSEADSRQLMRRVLIVQAGKRPVASQFFEGVGAALMRRLRLRIRYFTRSRRQSGDREISPQRLVYYRNTWYVDGWCHGTDALKRFALDAIEDAEILDTKARDIALKRVEEALDGGYGIYAGSKVQWATLLFSADAAIWVSREQWHPEQEITQRDDGRLEMRLPFADPTELVMDVLRHGAEVEVLAPRDLRKAVANRIALMGGIYA